jgi:hypothetical protein
MKLDGGGEGAPQAEGCRRNSEGGVGIAVYLQNRVPTKSLAAHNMRPGMGGSQQSTIYECSVAGRS